MTRTPLEALPAASRRAPPFALAIEAASSPVPGPLRAGGTESRTARSAVRMTCRRSVGTAVIGGTAPPFRTEPFAEPADASALPAATTATSVQGAVDAG